ncbi:MAG TPA: hypothetical protein DCS07_03825 [Bdellovibrionales bacterium]|nr:MAG: hypothetical protein A2Z97_02675 [Bdellovibrionales bacterium GWB1_52_6]OFZ03474.1 MAG: hypothetical protein A2X97_05880 [Bdellovibrionales bacterium GWA1_52_35]OFZ41360.1 MAG: hypothetical protein A2070_05220 [Bdellovibrionales bacterium GWC1_52_8]HAR41747.1 hypothetical protein [Bdellovibrionales bacterium]HCM41058.1 hypothetical protein [Bdellovibrionales bacterium]
MKFGAAAILPVLLLGTAQAAMLGPESSWEEIARSGMIGGFPMIPFRYSQVSADELCIDGDNFKPLQPYRQVCTAFDARLNRCERHETRYFSTPRTYAASRCVKWNVRGDNCLSSESYIAVHPTAYMVSVYYKNVKSDLQQKFKKRFEIPACE